MDLALLILGLISSTLAKTLISSNIHTSGRPPPCQLKHYTFFNHTPFSYVIEEPTLCLGETFMVNYVQSSSDHFFRRNLIRETWGSMKSVHSQSVRLLFIVGRPKSQDVQAKIQNESNFYRDLVQADFEDTYMNLTLKHIVALHWITKFCAHAKFISKTDDDTFVDIFSLIEFTKENLIPQEKFIYGQIFRNEGPIRLPGYKWTVGKDLYEPDKYPPFAKGFAYLISRSAIKPLLICSFYHKYLYIDDVFITGIVAQIANVTLKTFKHNYGYTVLRHPNITEADMDHVFYVGRNTVTQDQWTELWKHSLKMVL